MSYYDVYFYPSATLITDSVVLILAFGSGMDPFNEKLPPRPELTDEDRKHIKSSAPLLEPDKLGVKITKHMYERMLSDHPILKNVFSHSKQTVSVWNVLRLHLLN